MRIKTVVIAIVIITNTFFVVDDKAQNDLLSSDLKLHSGAIGGDSNCTDEDIRLICIDFVLFL